MENSNYNDSDIRRYLLGMLDDGELRNGIDERLFADDEFAAVVESVEDDVINQHVFNDLTDEENVVFSRRLAESKTLQNKVRLAKNLHEIAVSRVAKEPKPSLFSSIAAFFKQPLVAGGFAVLLVTVVGLIYWTQRTSTTELADLRAIYKNERPTMARISEFEYAPLVTRRGNAEDREAARLRRIELALLERTETVQTAGAFHDLGRFYLTQQRFTDAVKALERSLSLDGKNVGVLNDLGSVYLERSRSEQPSEKFKSLSTALEKFAYAEEIAPTDRASVFNKAQCLQALSLNNEAKKAWQRYLELDNNSGWADEARKALEKLDVLSATKSKEQVADEVLAAAAAGDTETVWRIQSETREMMTGLWVPGQLIRRYIEARARGDAPEADRNIAAVRAIGELEASRNADFFVSEMVDFYAMVANTDGLRSANAMLFDGFSLLYTKKADAARAKFVESREAFAAGGDRWNSMIADLWVAHALSDLSKIEESDGILRKLKIECASKRFVWLGVHIDDWMVNNRHLRGDSGRSIAMNRELLEQAEVIGDVAFSNRSNGMIAERYQSIGDTRRAIDHVGRIDLNVSHGSDGSRRWRRNYLASLTAVSFGTHRSAELFAQEALENALSGQLKASQAVDDTLRLLIKISSKMGDFSKALRYAGEARERALATEDPTMRAKILRYALVNIAELQHAEGDFEAAILTYDEVLALQNADAEVQLDQFTANRGRAQTLMALGRSSELEGQLAKTIKLSEQFRSKILDHESRIAFIEGERELSESMVAHALDQGDAVKAFEVSEASRARGLLDFVAGEVSVDQLADRFPTVSTTSSLAELRGGFPADIQLIQYAVLHDKLALWYITKDRFEYVEAPITDKDLETEIDNVLDSVVRQIAENGAVRKRTQKLYGSLIAPVAHLLDKQKQLVIVADGPLNKLPFAILANTSGQYLIEDFTVSYAPSTNIFVRMTKTATQRRSAEESLLAVGDPAFDSQKEPLLDALPSAATEARNVALQYTKGSTLIGNEATKTRFLSLLPTVSVVHYAGHYVVNENSPANSRVVLAAGEDSPDLTLIELLKLRIDRSALVVLSACETNSENIVTGEGSTGIAQKFIAIGAPLVVAGSWKIDSDRTSTLMQAFHKNRRIGKMTTAKALREAQLAAMTDQNGSPTPPFYWAAFAAIGGYTEY